MHRDQGCCGPGSVRDEGDEEGGKYVKESKWRDVIATLLPLVKKGRAGGRENENRREEGKGGTSLVVWWLRF